MYTYTYMCIHTSIYMYTCIYIHIYMHIYMYKNMYMHKLPQPKPITAHKILYIYIFIYMFSKNYLQQQAFKTKRNLQKDDQHFNLTRIEYDKKEKKKTFFYFQ